MSRERERLFGSSQAQKGDFDLSGFGTKLRPKDAPTVRATIEHLAHDAGFASRDPRREDSSSPRTGRVTGRNAQINLKARPEIIDAFSQIAHRHDWSKALTFERAVAALERLLGEGVDPKTLDLGG